MSDDVRRRILERRAAFVAAAIASLTACERTDTTSASPVSSEMKKTAAPPDTIVDASIGPAVCLSESPQPCLAPPPLPTTDARPIACLSPRPKPPPTK